MPRRVLGRIAVATAIVVVAVLAASWWWTHRPIRWRDTQRPPAPAAAAIDAFSRGEIERGVASIEESERRYDAPFWEPKVRLAGAWHAMESGQPQLALQLLGPPRPGDTLAPWADLLRAQAALAAGRVGDAEGAAERAAIEGFPEAAEAASVRAAALERLGRAEEARRVLDAAPALRLDAARLAARAGDRADARRRLAAIVVDPAIPGEEAVRALDELRALEPDPGARFTDAAPVVATAMRWIEARRPGPALDLLRAPLRPGAPPSARSPEAALAEAEAMLRLGRIADTAPLLARARAGDRGTVDGALHLEARVYEARGLGKVAAAKLAALSRRPGRSKAKIEAMADLAQIVEGAPNPAALAAWRRYRETAGDAADPVALLREGFAALELGRNAEADAGFARVLARRNAPDGVRAAATYWVARRAETSGRRDEGRRLYETLLRDHPNHVYGMFAERRLGRPLPAPSDAPEAPVPAARAGSGTRWLENARLLRRLSLWAWAAAAFGAAAETATDDVARSIRLEAADGALDRGLGAEAARWIVAAIGDRDRQPPGALPRRYWKVILPMPSGTEIAKAAAAARLDPAFVAAVVMEESAFDPRAVSAVGARGLLQLMPPTGAEVARSLGLRGFTSDRLFDPETNLRLGTTYLRRLLDRYGAVAPALAAYNAGPSRADRWRRRGDDPLGDRFTERVPIPATRLYVKGILANERLYRIVWGSGTEERRP